MTRLARPLTLFVLGACATAPVLPPKLHFDVRPAMDAVREDAAAIQRSLAEDRIADAVLPAHRLAALDLAPGYEAPEEFRRLAVEFRDSAARLRTVLEQERAREAGLQFEQLLRRCDACHARYRRSGVAGR
jgi:cytochrome c556